MAMVKTGQRFSRFYYFCYFFCIFCFFYAAYFGLAHSVVAADGRPQNSAGKSNHHSFGYSSSRSNIFGGYDYKRADGTEIGSSRKNVFGGYDYKVKEKEKEQGQSRNNGKDAGSEISRTRTFSTRKNVFGGEDVTER